MKYDGGIVNDVKIAYIGGGSKGWAWGLMSDLADCCDMSGEVWLYDIDFDAAKANEIIGNKYNKLKETKSFWVYKANNSIEDTLQGADFVIISILPGTLDEMYSDVHTPEKYGIYQSVGDTTGPGGILRAMRTVPMYEYIAKKIEENCPEAWVINYTNPMTLCVKTLYRVFPGIKAFGCCHEVFGTQTLLAKLAEKVFGAEHIDRHEIKVNPVAVNHFTWLTKAEYRNNNLFPYYREFCSGGDDEIIRKGADNNWMNKNFKCTEKVKMDLFNRYGYIAAAGDRHLAEFCEGKWYLESPERVKEMGFALTPVNDRKTEYAERKKRSEALVSGDEEVSIKKTGEEGVSQMRTILGLHELVTNVNMPNAGQIPNLPLGAVVETNAVFRSNTVTPVFAGNIPHEIYAPVSRICAQQEAVSEAIAQRDLHKIFAVFVNDPLVTCSIHDARQMFREMCDNTKEYLSMYDLDNVKI